MYDNDLVRQAAVKSCIRLACRYCVFLFFGCLHRCPPRRLIFLPIPTPTLEIMGHEILKNDIILHGAKLVMDVSGD